MDVIFIRGKFALWLFLVGYNQSLNVEKDTLVACVFTPHCDQIGRASLFPRLKSDYNLVVISIVQACPKST